MAKTFLVTHNDMDGFGCSLIGQVYGGIDPKNIVHCSYDTIEDELEKIPKEFTKIFIVDICPRKEVVDELDDRFKIIDHHQTNYYLKGSSSHIMSNDSCGCKLFFEYLSKRNPKKSDSYYKHLTDTIDTCDRFTYEKASNKEEALNLNILYRFYGPSLFLKKFLLPRTIQNGTMFHKPELSLAKYLRAKDLKMYEKYAKEITILKDNKGRTYSIIFRDEPESLLFNHIVKERDLDYLVAINPLKNSVSLCSTTIDVSKFAKKMGGGGHKFASGFSIKSPLDFLDTIKKGLKLELFDTIS